MLYVYLFLSLGVFSLLCYQQFCEVCSNKNSKMLPSQYTAHAALSKHLKAKQDLKLNILSNFGPI